MENFRLAKRWKKCLSISRRPALTPENITAIKNPNRIICNLVFCLKLKSRVCNTFAICDDWISENLEGLYPRLELEWKVSKFNINTSMCARERFDWFINRFSILETAVFPHTPANPDTTWKQDLFFFQNFFNQIKFGCVSAFIFYCSCQRDLQRPSNLLHNDSIAT